MRWSSLWSLVFIAIIGATWLGCGGSQEPVAEPEPPPPPPQPTAEPRVWDNESSYQVGWPITVRTGVFNVGDTVVNAPRGEFFGVNVQAWRIEQVEVAPEPQPAPAQGEAQQGGAQQGEAQQGGSPQGEGTSEPAAPAEPPAPRIEERREAIDCESVRSESPRGGVFPLATSSSTNRRIHVDQLCNLDRPGRYAIELVVDVPATEGSDVSGPQTAVPFQFELTLPDPPLVARADVGQELFETGDPIDMTVRVTNYGAEPVRIAGAEQLQIQLSAESNGESVPCSEPERGRGRGGNLPPGDRRETTVNLVERCQLTLPGRYAVTAQVVVPASGTRSFSGTLEAPAVSLEIAAPEPPVEQFEEEGGEGSVVGEGAAEDGDVLQ